MSSRDPLSDTLQSWRHEPAEAPQFALEVWARVHATKPASARQTALYRWVLPVAASLALAAGVGSAVRVSHQQHSERMARAYAQSIDPFQMHGASQP